TYYPEILLPADSPSSPLHPNILRQQTLAQQVQNQVSYYKERFSKALIALKIISVAPYEIILDSETFTVSDAISKAHALLLNEKAEGTTTYSANGMTYKPIIHGPSTGTKNQQTLNSIDIILLSPAVPDFGYFHYGQGMAFCVLSPEEQAKVYVEYLSNISRQILQDYNLPTLVYLEEAGTYGTGPICPWNDIKRANLTKEIMRYSANLSYAGIIGLHDPHPYQAPSLSNPAEDQPFCMLQEASRLSVELQTHSAYYKLSAQDSACTCEPCTRMEQSAGKCSPACADGASCDMEGVQAGWPYGYKCPSLCANTDSCEERLCEGILVDFPSSSGNLICQYSDVPMSFEVSPEALLASPDNYADILSSLPEVYRCCFSEIDEYGETDYYSYSKLDTQGREVFPIIYGTKGRDFPECKPSADISESCVFSQFYSNNQLTCGFSEGEFGVSPFPDLCIPGKYGSGIVCPSLPGFYSGPSCCQSGMEQWCCGSDETYGNTCESSYSCSTSLSPSHYCGEENICSSPNPYCCRAELEPGEGYTTFCCPDQNTCLTAPSSCALA
ncbi:hypothetical protein COV61_03815, partial [Candidatus Micrarchaeota archaeon CG11_big_fil_rev_8_21_14_0_20_47_5]